MSKSAPPKVTPKVTEDLTRHVANLARLDLGEQEVRIYTAQIQEVLNYVNQLQDIDVKGIAPLTHPLDLHTPMREDVVKPFPKDEHGRPKILQSAPEIVQDGSYKVPPII